jgi:hypothetical protein
MDITRIKEIVTKKDLEYTSLETNHKLKCDELEEVEDEMNLKSGENNRLRKQVTDLEKSV